MYIRENEVTSPNQSTIVALKLKSILYLFQRAPTMAHYILHYNRFHYLHYVAIEINYLCSKNGDIHESLLGSK